MLHGREQDMYDAVVIGYGPAGTSGALYLLRGGCKTLLIGRDGGSLTRAPHIENFYGQKGPVSGSELLLTGLEQVKALGGEVASAEITSIGFAEERFTVGIPDGEYQTKTVLIATGRERKKTPVEGIERFEGKGISYCAVCDGFFYCGKKVAVLGEGEFALSEALELKPLVSQVTICTNGFAPTFRMQEGVAVDSRKIKGIDGGDTVSGIAFEEGEPLPADGVFVAMGSASGLDFAKKLGLDVKDGALRVNENQMTNLSGVFAAGDCTGGVLQISVAVGEGAKAGLAMVEYIRNFKKT
jgi:thioredoxin reductase (NADPH)